MATIAERQPDEQVRRDREDVPGLAQAAEVGDRDQRDRHERDLDPDVVGRREDRLDLGDRRRGRDGDGHDVVDQQRRGGDQPEDRREVRPGDDVGPAAVRIGPTDLAVRHRDDRQQERDRDRRPGSTGAARPRRRRAGPAGSPRSRRPTSEIASELKIASAFFFERRSSDLLLVRQRPPEDDGPEPGEGATASRPRDGRRLARDQLARAGVAEVRGMRPFDANPPVARLSALERPPSPDHDSISERGDRDRPEPRSDDEADRARAAHAAGGTRRRRPAPRQRPVNAAPSAPSRQHSVIAHGDPGKDK